MKKKFTEPKLQVKRFETMDVIATSEIKVNSKGETVTKGYTIVFD